jgi:hypothetical protein
MINLVKCARDLHFRGRPLTPDVLQDFAFPLPPMLNVFQDFLLRVVHHRAMACKWATKE